MIVYTPPAAARAIPVIDMAGSFAAGAARDAVAQAIHRAARETGFFYVTGHGVPAGTMAAQLAMTRALFALGEADKQALSVAHSPCRRGYEGPGRQVLDAGSAADFKESFMLARDLGPEHPYVRAGLPMQGANQWPEIAGFRAQMAAWEGEMIRLGRHLMGCLALSVDLAYDWFADGLADPQCGVRLLRYPPQPDGAAGNLLGAGAHSDWGSITILLQDEMAGLEVLNTDDAWILATPIEGTFVINLGQMMERFTGGLYRANLHRVRNNAAAQARHSVATFFELAPDYRMRVAPTCPGGDVAGEAPTIGQHLEDMARASYAA